MKKGNRKKKVEKPHEMQKFCYLYKEELNEELNEGILRFGITAITQGNIEGYS